MNQFLPVDVSSFFDLIYVYIFLFLQASCVIDSFDLIGIGFYEDELWLMSIDCLKISCLSYMRMGRVGQLMGSNAKKIFIISMLTFICYFGEEYITMTVYCDFFIFFYFI